MRNKLYYLVDWLGYTPNDQTWEPTENISNAPELVQEFHRCYPNKPSPSSCIATRGTVMMVLPKHHIEIRTFNLLAEVHMVLSQNAMMKIRTCNLPTKVSSLNH